MKHVEVLFVSTGVSAFITSFFYSITSHIPFGLIPTGTTITKTLFALFPIIGLIALFIVNCGWSFFTFGA